MVDNKKIQEMQFLEQNFQNIILQKQACQMELSETNSALKEIEKAGDEVFKIIGQLMIKTDKSNTKKELEDKKKVLDLRIKAIEKQEASLAGQLEKFREEVVKSVNK
jgi:prefoldin beta subunit